MFAPENIDKIKILLNPIFINPDNKKQHIDPYNRLTLHKAGAFLALSIHEEYFKPYPDMLMNIADAIYDLYTQGIVEILFLQSDNAMLIRWFIFCKLKVLVLNVTELEFYFNMRRENIIVLEKAVVYGYLKKIVGKRTGAITYYTNDNRDYRDSIGIIYDKAAKLKKDNRTSYKKIDANPFQIRLEFRLRNDNCAWLNLNNLQGTYENIIKRFRPLLAIKYKKFFLGHIQVLGNENKQLRKIIDEAETTTRERYTSTDRKLKQAKPIPEELRSPKKIEGKAEKMNALGDRFLKENQNVENDKKYAHFVDNMAKINPDNGQK
jgi:hypothetical protein